jgi:uncharacterized membrane protein
MLQGYEEVLPGAADRILRMAEDQAMHRQHLERTVVQSKRRIPEKQIGPSEASDENASTEASDQE